MRMGKVFLFVLAGALLLAVSPPANAQVAVGVQIGPEPVCPYGYYDVAPYNCAPYGYYGPEWFNGGAFFGIGPWFRGPDGFHGHVDYRYDPRHGYRGPYPERGDQRFNHFHGTAERDSRGHEYHGGGHDDHGGGHDDHGGGHGDHGGDHGDHGGDRH